MKNPIKKNLRKSESAKEYDIRKKQKTRRRLLISIGGIIFSAALVTSLSVGISIAKKEVK